MKPILERGSGWKAGEDFFPTYSPEREDPKSGKSGRQNSKGYRWSYGSVRLDKAKAIYSIAIETLVPVSSCRAAEATKLLENIFRCVNIALVNELKVIYREMGIDIWEVIEAAKTKPFGYMAFYSYHSRGALYSEFDPFYMSWKAKQYGKKRAL